MKKFVKFDLAEYKKIRKKENEKEPWNCMQFIGCEVMNLSTTRYNCGERMSLEICAPRLKRRFFLFAWKDNPVFDAIMRSGLKKGDRISVYTEMGYYKSSDKDRSGSYQEAYQIVPNMNFQGDKETPHYFKLMYIEREDEPKEKQENSPYISKDELLRKMMG